MQLKHFCYLLLCVSTFTNRLVAQTDPIVLSAGMTITTNVTFKPGVYYLPAFATADSAAVVIKGTNITVDFTGVTIMGAPNTTMPDQYEGVGILVQGGKDIKVIAPTVKGYKIGILAIETKEMLLKNANCSYNYRPRLKSSPLVADTSDILHYQVNQFSFKEDWLKYGAGIFIKNCNAPSIKNCLSRENQNGLMMVKSNSGIIINNDFGYNSGVGLGLYRCNTTKIWHNKIDFCVRSHSQIYSQDSNSAGILLLDESNNNNIANNSVTHNGHGLLMRCIETTAFIGAPNMMGNLVYGNDFSHNVFNALESYAGFHKIVNNKITHSKQGIWSSNTYENIVMGNQFENVEAGIVTLNGHDNSYYFNRFENAKQGMIVAHSAKQVYGKGYITALDSASHDYRITQNLFNKIDIPLMVNNVENCTIAGNQFNEFGELLRAENNTGKYIIEGNKIYTGQNLGAAASVANSNETLTGEKPKPVYSGSAITVYAPKKDPDTQYQDVALDSSVTQGKANMMVTGWGAYNGQYPYVRLREIKGEEIYIIELLGPAGDWELAEKGGVRDVSHQKGTLPSILEVSRKATDEALKLQFKYTARTAFQMPNGQNIKPGEVLSFGLE